MGGFHLVYLQPMITAAETEARFRAELAALLARYDGEPILHQGVPLHNPATLEAEDHYPGYAECGEDVRMTVSIPSIVDPATYEIIREGMEIDLGKYFP